MICRPHPHPALRAGLLSLALRALDHAMARAMEIDRCCFPPPNILQRTDLGKGDSNKVSEPRIRICQLITELEPAGAERVVCELATRLDKDRFEVQVAALRGGVVTRRLEEAGVKVTVLGVRHKLDFGKVFTLARTAAGRANRPAAHAPVPRRPGRQGCGRIGRHTTPGTHGPRG